MEAPHEQSRVCTRIRFDTLSLGQLALVTQAGVMRVMLQNLCQVDATAASTSTSKYRTFCYADHAHTAWRLQELYV
jgi:hypothetical protein